MQYTTYEKFSCVVYCAIKQAFQRIMKGRIMTGKEIENIICAICFFGWIPILALFGGVAKVISAFKGNCTGENDTNVDTKHKSDDCNEEE